MPLDSNGNAIKPADATAVTNTPIKSAMFNGLVDDIYAILNYPRPIQKGGTGATSVPAAQAALSVDNRLVYSLKSASYAATVNDNNAFLRFSAGATLTLPAPPQSGWHITVFADAGAVTVTPSGGATINGAASLVGPVGTLALIVSDGTAFRAVLVLDASIAATKAQLEADLNASITAAKAELNASIAAAKAELNASIAGQSVGMIAYFSADGVLPAGWIKANGAVLSRTTFQALWVHGASTAVSEAAWLGGYYGRFSFGDEATTFRIPDLRGYFLRAWDNGRGIDSGRTLGDHQASQNLSHGHAVSDPGHLHTYNDTIGIDNFGGGGGSGHTVMAGPAFSGRITGVSGTGISIQSSGGTEARPVNLSLTACIKY